MINCTKRLFSRRLAGSSLLGTVFAIGFASSGLALSLGPLVQVTGADPFTSCTADNVHQQETAYGSVLFPNTVIEPWVAADPTNPSRLLVGHHQDRWNDGGARGLVGVASSDGGATWADATPQDVTECTGGKYARGSDPWTAFANDGTALFLSLVLDPAKPTTPFGARNSAILVSRSTDHGATWGGPATLIDTKTSHALNDKDSLTADPTSNGLVYVAWDQLSVFPPSQTDPVLGQSEGIPLARDLLNSKAGASAVCVPFTKPPCKGGAPFYKFNFTGPSMLARSANNGVNWGTPTAIYSPGTNAQTIDNLVQVTPNGDVYDFFTAINVTSPGALNIGYVRSTNKGLGWSGPTFATDIQVVGVVSPDSGQPLRDASILYSISVNPVSGAIYLAWQDDRFSTANCITPTTPAPGIPVDGIAFTQSLDGGVTWSTPIMINQTPSNPNPCRQQAFVPAIVATGDGNAIVVTYYDFRNDTNTPVGFEATDYFAVICTTANDCSKAGSWGDGQRLTTASFNILNAPIARGHFLGDYMGLAASGPTTAVPVFGVATTPNVTVEYTRVISGLP